MSKVPRKDPQTANDTQPPTWYEFVVVVKEASACVFDRLNSSMLRWSSRMFPSSFSVQSTTHEGKVLPGHFGDATARAKI